MDYTLELEQERNYTARVQQLLYAVIQASRGNATFQDDTIRMMLSDAWQELREKPTSLSQQDIDQINIEIDRFVARRTFSEARVAEYEKMLKSPFFARIDFQEDGQDAPEKIIIGLYTLKSANEEIMVHDWRAPVCSLYYDATPGSTSFESPGGTIAGTLTLKRQYVMENGRLKYFVNTEYSIDDSMLLDILSNVTSSHMRQIVSTIQSEQNAAIRHEKGRVLSVTGGAGSGKTSVAMHRAAYLMYRHRNILNAECIAVLSPTNAFSEYISCVLPDLGEENTQALTLHDIIDQILEQKTETPFQQYEELLQPENEIRRESVRWKSDSEYLDTLNQLIDTFSRNGPSFEPLTLGKHTIMTKAEMARIYREEIRFLTPAQRLNRVRVSVESRLEDWEKSLYQQYEAQLIRVYKDRKNLEFATRMAVAQRLHPLRTQMKKMLTPDLNALYASALKNAPADIYRTAQENAAANLIWWEDAPGMALLAVRLGFVKPNQSIRHLLIDEAQDYSDTALKLLAAWFPKADVTLLGDPNQRTLPAMSACHPETWGELMGVKDAPLVHLSRSYRSSLEITHFCNLLLPEGSTLPQAFGRHGKMPEVNEYSVEALQSQLDGWLSKGYNRVAVITRTQSEAALAAMSLKKCFLLTGNLNELEDTGIIVGALNQMKGLEFDAVAIVWPADTENTDDERRRMYTACSRALHELAIFHRID